MIYIVVEKIDTQPFVEEVNEWIGKGFKPLGGIATIDVEGNTVLYTQAMVSVDGPKVIEEPIKIPQPSDITIVRTQRDMRGVYPKVKVKYMYGDVKYHITLEDNSMGISQDSIILSCLEDVRARGV